MSVNKAILVGRLGKDPETRFTQSGQSVSNFSVATDNTYKDKNGEKQKKTEWHKIVAWGKLSEIVGKYLKKGALVYLEGRIETREWQDKEGQKRYSTEIVADTLRMFGGGERSDSAKPAQAVAASGDDFAGGEIDDSDIPF